MGGMETWIFAHKYPELTDVAVPMASLPIEMSGRSWMLRRQITDSIRSDPEWMNGNYSKSPRSAQFASVFYGIATDGGNQTLQRIAGRRQKADDRLNTRLGAKFTADANDERNPSELGVMESEIKRVKNGRAILIPASDQTAGHGTAYFAKNWKQELGTLLDSAPVLMK